jgi:hypothetical protein
MAALKARGEYLVLRSLFIGVFFISCKSTYSNTILI